MVQDQGTFRRTLQNFISPKTLQKWFLPSDHELLQACKLFIRCLWKVMATVQFHLLYKIWKKICLLEKQDYTNQRKAERHYWQLFKDRYYEVFCMTVLPWAVTSESFILELVSFCCSQWQKNNSLMNGCSLIWLLTDLQSFSCQGLSFSWWGTKKARFRSLSFSSAVLLFALILAKNPIRFT